MSRPTHILRHEHRVIEQGLRALDGMCSRLELGETASPEAFDRLLDFIQFYADRAHHEKEERLLFPALMKSGFELEEEPLEFLKQEHEIERELSNALGVEFAAYRNGNPEAARLFTETAREYINHLVRHMRREDAILFRLVEEILDEPAKDELCQALNDANARLGPGTMENYERVADELERQWTL
jgi:hemerythrin-like domain-containing protein